MEKEQIQQALAPYIFSPNVRWQLHNVYVDEWYAPNNKKSDGIAWWLDYDAKRIRPELLSLKNISDEHAIEVAKILGVEYAKEPFGSDKHFDKEGLIQFVQEIFTNAYCDAVACNAIKLFQYLQSLGYDVPLYFGLDNPNNGKTAIELGIAIEKEVGNE